MAVPVGCAMSPGRHDIGLHAVIPVIDDDIDEDGDERQEQQCHHHEFGGLVMPNRSLSR